MTTAGHIVRKLRKQKGLTLEQLANHIPDFDAGNLSRFERGKQGIAEDKLKAIAGALGTTVSEIYALAEGSEPPAEHKFVVRDEAAERTLTEDEKDLLAQYRAADEQHRDIARRALNITPPKRPVLPTDEEAQWLTALRNLTPAQRSDLLEKAKQAKEEKDQAFADAMKGVKKNAKGSGSASGGRTG